MNSMVNQMDRLHSFSPLVYACANTNVNLENVKMLVAELHALSKAAAAAPANYTVKQQQQQQKLMLKQVLELQMQQAILVSCSTGNEKVLKVLLKSASPILQGETLAKVLAFAKSNVATDAACLELLNQAESKTT